MWNPEGSPDLAYVCNCFKDHTKSCMCEHTENFESPAMGSRRVGHDWSDLAVAAAATVGWYLCVLLSTH